MESYEQIRDEWISVGKIAKFLGTFSSPRFHEDWEVAEPEESIRKNSRW